MLEQCEEFSGARRMPQGKAASDASNRKPHQGMEISLGYRMGWEVY
jgi:hypothetical protein